MADTAVETAGAVNTNVRGRGIFGPYWISTTIGAILLQDVNGALIARKTTDSGATWGAAVLFEAGAVDTAYSCFFDGQSPTAATGTKVHAVILDSTAHDFSYAAYDILTNTWSTAVDLKTDTTEAVAGLNACFIAKSRANGFVAGYVASALQSNCYRSDDGVTWGAAANLFESNAIDVVLGLSVHTDDARDVGILFGDETAAQASLKLYDYDQDTWTEILEFGGAGSCQLAADATLLSAATRLSDEHTIVAFLNDVDAAGNDLKVYDCNLNSIATPTITALADALTDSAETGNIGVFIDQSNSNIYVVYGRGTTFGSAIKIFFKKSTDGGATWSNETAYSEAAEADYAELHAGVMGASTLGGRFQPSFFNDALNDVFVNLTNAVTIAATTTPGNAGIGMGSRAWAANWSERWRRF